METESGGLIRDIEAQLRSWERFYEIFGFKENFSGIWVPIYRADFDCLIAVPEDLTPEWILKKLKEFMPVDKYLDSLDVVKSVRKTDQRYVIWVRNRQEADEELQNLSIGDLGARKINCITLEERLLLEMKYFIETRQDGQAGQHLDEQSATLCGGSVDPDGYVPGVRCYPSSGLIDIDYCHPFMRADFLRGREVVS